MQSREDIRRICDELVAMSNGNFVFSISNECLYMRSLTCRYADRILIDHIDGIDLWEGLVSICSLKKTFLGDRTVSLSFADGMVSTEDGKNNWTEYERR